jgi:hypothetical protein
VIYHHTYSFSLLMVCLSFCSRRWLGGGGTKRVACIKARSRHFTPLIHGRHSIIHGGDKGASKYSQNTCYNAMSVALGNSSTRANAPCCLVQAWTKKNRDCVMAILHVSSIEIEERYLGLPTTQGEMTKGKYKSMMEALVKRFTNWTERHMSLGGKRSSY